MAYLIDSNLSDLRLKKFNGVRRTKEGMLYLTSSDLNYESGITFSKYVEPGKSDLVPKDGETDYIEERLEYLTTQTFTGDGSTTAFTLNIDGLTADRIAVFVDEVRKIEFTDFTLSGTTLTFVFAPLNGKVIVVGQINRRRFNNDSDNYQQFVYSSNPTTTYLINSNGELVKRINDAVSRTAESSDDFDTFEALSTVNTTTYQDAV